MSDSPISATHVAKDPIASVRASMPYSTEEYDREYDLLKLELAELEKMMEEMAGTDRSEYGKRQPGERCKYETYRMEDQGLRSVSDA